MLKQVQVFDKDVFEIGQSVYVRFPGNFRNNFYALVTGCELEKLFLVAVAPKSKNIISYTSSVVQWQDYENDIKLLSIDIDKILSKKVEIVISETSTFPD